MMTMVEPKRLTDLELNEIARRLSMPMNDDGLRAWYRQDVVAMMEEVLYLRREHAQAMTIFARNPPLDGLEHMTSMVEVARRLSEMWDQQVQGVWQKIEVKRIREKLEIAQAALEDCQRNSAERNERVIALLTKAKETLE